MTVSTRNKTAAYLAIVGGILILIAGGTGMATFLAELGDIIQDHIGKNEIIDTIFWILIIIAALGGLTVMLGGFLFYKEYIRVGKFLIMLGAGLGLIGLIIALISALYQGEEAQFFSWLTTSFMGVGLILSIISTYVAKRPDLSSDAGSKSRSTRASSKRKK